MKAMYADIVLPLLWGTAAPAGAAGVCLWTCQGLQIRKYLTITTVSHGQEHKRKQAASGKALLVKCGFRLYGIYGSYSRGCTAVCLRRQGDRVWSAYTDLFLNPKRSLERFGHLWKASCFSRYPFLYATGHFDLRVCLTNSLAAFRFMAASSYALSRRHSGLCHGKVLMKMPP